MEVLEKLRNLGKSSKLQEEGDEEEEEDDLPGSWKWVVCAGSFSVLFIILGIHYSFGVIFAGLMDYFSHGRSATAWVGSIGFSSLCFFGPFAGVMCDRYGCRVVTIAGSILCSIGLFTTSFVTSIYTMYFTYGLVFGFGSCLAYTPALVVICKYFIRRRALATGITTAGGSAGVFIMGPLLRYLIDAIGLMHTFRVLSVLTLLVSVFGSSYDRNLEEDERPLLDDKEQTPTYTPLKLPFDLQLFKNPAFVVCMASLSIALFGYYIPSYHMMQHAKDLGIPPKTAALLYTYMGITSGISRVISGALTTAKITNVLYFYQVGLFGIGFATLLSSLATTYEGLLVFFVVFGIFDGIVMGMKTMVLYECVGKEKMAQAWGMMLFTMALTLLTGPPVAGMLADKFHSYTLAFTLAGMSSIIGGALLTAIPWSLRRVAVASEEYSTENEMPLVKKRVRWVDLSPQQERKWRFL